MDLQTLQNAILSNQQLPSFIIFHNSENSFLANQYTDAIAVNKSLKKVYVEDPKSLIPDKDDIFGITQYIDDKCLYVSHLETFNIYDRELSKVTNLIIICNKLDTDCKDIFSEFIIEMPKLEDWHIKDYVYSIADGVDTKKLDWLISICNSDIYRLTNEINKLSIFNKKERDHLFEQFCCDEMFSDLTNFVVFDLTNAIIKRDIQKVGMILEDLTKGDFEPLGIQVILTNNFRNIIQVQMSQNATAEKLGMKSNQFYAVKKNTGYYNKDQLVTIYDRIASCDYKMKNGEISNDKLIDYMMLNIFSA